MANERNKPASLRAGMKLPKAAVLRERKHFDRLFDGSATILSEEHVSLRFYLDQAANGDCKIGFIVPKRLGKAVKRNYVKRIFREVYRQNRLQLVEMTASLGIDFYGAFMAQSMAIDFKTAETELQHLLDRTAHRLQADSML